jgi:hypothetical protein
LAYPNSVKSFTTKVSGQNVDEGHINDLQTEVNAIESGLLTAMSHDIDWNDNVGPRLGTGNDATFLYDGTDVVLNTQAAGSGVFVVLGGQSVSGVEINNTATDGDPVLAFALSGTSVFTMGVDDGDSDKFKIGTTAIGTNTRVTIDASGNVGIGTDSPASGLHYLGDELRFQGLNPFFAFYSLSSGLRLGFVQAHESGDFALKSDKSGTDMTFTTTSANFTFSGGNASFGANVSITGSLSKGSGSFKIDHPLASKEDTHFLVHSFLEGPRADLLYRGTATLVSGSATVDLDTAAGMTTGTWVVLCRDAQVFTSNESGWDTVRGSMRGSTLTIECQDAASTDTVSWMVVAERKDKHMYDTEWTDAEGHVVVEPEKTAEKKVKSR